MATNGPLGPPMIFRSRTTKAALIVIEQNASSRSAAFSTSLMRTSVISIPSRPLFLCRPHLPRPPTVDILDRSHRSLAHQSHPAAASGSRTVGASLTANTPGHPAISSLAATRRASVAERIRAKQALPLPVSNGCAAPALAK